MPDQPELDPFLANRDNALAVHVGVDFLLGLGSAGYLIADTRLLAEYVVGQIEPVLAEDDAIEAALRAKQIARETFEIRRQTEYGQEA